MIRFTKSDIVDTELYEQHLRHDGYIMFNKAKAAKILKQENLKRDNAMMYCLDTMYQRSAGYCYRLAGGDVYSLLVDFEKCPEHYLDSKNAQGFTVAITALEPLYKNGYATDFLEAYLLYSSLNSKCNKMNKLLTDGGYVEDENGLIQLGYNVAQQVNLRYAYRQVDIIGIPKEYSSCVTAGEDYVLAWGDFAQSDFRIAYQLYLRDEPNPDIENTNDMYEAAARLMASRLDKEFDEEVFKEQRKLYKRECLAVIYGTETSTVEEERAFVEEFSAFVKSCKKYSEYCARLDRAIESDTLVSSVSYFGHQETKEISPSSVKHVRNFFLNSPIQTATSEIVILTSNWILEQFRKLGYTEDQVSLYYTRHDEPIFRLHKSAMKDAWVFRDARKICVDDWIPLDLKFSFGVDYSVEDETYMQRYEEICAAVPEKIYGEDRGLSSQEFYPIKPTFLLQTASAETPAGTVVAIYSPDLNAAEYLFVENKNEVEQRFLQAIAAYASKVDSNVYRSVAVHTNFSATRFNVGRLPVNVQSVANTTMYHVSCLANYRAIAYCRTNGLSEEGLICPQAADAPFIEAVRRLRDCV